MYFGTSFCFCYHCKLFVFMFVFMWICARYKSLLYYYYYIRFEALHGGNRYRLGLR